MIKVMLKRKLRGLLIAALVMIQLWLCGAWAETLEVTAQGKDLKTATVNAQVVAVRTVMNDMLEKSFVKQHVKELRGIIATADQYAETPQITSQNSKANKVELSARVEVRRAALAEALRALGARIVVSYREVYAQRRSLAEQVCSKIFGEGSQLLVSSTETAPQNQAQSKTEELEEENYLFGPPLLDTFSPGQHVTISYHRDEESARQDGYLILVAAAVPLSDYQSTNQFRESNSDKITLSGSNGFYDLITPLIPGNYELRLFNRNGDGTCAARWGFTVTAAAAPRFSLERNVFLPGEEIAAKLEDLAGYEYPKLVTVSRNESKARLSEAKILSRSDTLNADYNARLGKTFLTLKAPEEEGEYSLLMRIDSCKDCNWSNQLHQRSQALCEVPITVKKPLASDTYQIFLLPEYVSEGGLRVIITRPAQGENGFLRICKQDAPEGTAPLYEGWTNKQDVYVTKLKDLYETGDYKVDLFVDKQAEQPIFSTGFRVLENDKDRSLKPYLELYASEFEYGSRVHFDYVAKSEWSDEAFICLVSSDTPNDAVSSFKAAGNHMIKLYHRRFEEFVNIETEGLPAGAYDLRMYDRNDEQGRLQAVVSLQLKSEESTLKQTEEIEQMLDDLVSSKARPVRSVSYVSTVSRVDLRQTSNSRWHYDLNLLPVSGSAPTYKLISEYSRSERERLLPRAAFHKAASTKFKDACDLEVNQKIQENARIAYTLGRDSQLENELKNFGKSMLTEWAVPGGMEKVQTGFKIAFDAVEHGVEGLDAMSEGDYAKAAKEAALMMIKTTLNACSDADCFVGIVGSSEDSAAAYFGQLSDTQFSEFMRSIAKRVRTTNSDGKFANSLKTIYAPALARAKHMQNMEIAELTHKTLDSMVGLGSAALDSEADEGTESFISVDNGVVKTNAAGAVTTAVAEAICRMKPECAMVVASAKLSYQSALAARDFVRDSSVISAYSNWQKFEGTDAEWLIKAGGVRGLGKIGRGSLLQQVRNVMAKTQESNAMTRSCLSDEHKTVLKNKRRACQMYGAASEQCQSLKLTESDFTDEEIWAYLKKQFAEWEKLEQSNSEYAEFSKSMFEDFKKLDQTCALDFRNYYAKHLQQKEGWGTSLYNRLTFNTDKCKDEKAMFEAYLDLQARLDSLYQQVMPPQGKICSFKNVKNRRELAKQNLCSALHLYGDDRQLFMQKLLEDVAYDACLCGVSMSVVDGKLYKAGEEPAERMAKLSEKVKAQLEAEQKREERKQQNLNLISNYDDTYKIGVAMDHIGRRDVLNCMCNNFATRRAAIGGGCGYSGGGKCFCMGVTGHTWYSGMGNSAKAKEVCGYYSSLKQYVNRQSDDKSLKPMLSHQEVRQQLIEADEYLSLTKPNQCELKR